MKSEFDTADLLDQCEQRDPSTKSEQTKLTCHYENALRQLEKARSLLLGHGSITSSYWLTSNILFDLGVDKKTLLRHQIAPDLHFSGTEGELIYLGGVHSDEVELSNDFLIDLALNVKTSFKPLTAGHLLWMEIQAEKSFDND